MYAPGSRTLTARRVLLAVVGSIVAAMVVVGVVLAVSLSRDAAWRAPDFPSLAEEPDPSIHGTVAYLADATGCGRKVRAGRTSN